MTQDAETAPEGPAAVPAEAREAVVPASTEKSGPSIGAGDQTDEQVRQVLNDSADVVLSRLRSVRSVIVVVDWDLPEAAGNQMPLGIIRTFDGRLTNERVMSAMRGVLRFFDYLQSLVFKLCQMAIDKAARP